MALAVGIAAAPLAAENGQDVWTILGPDGGAVEALAIDPSSPRILYAGTFAGGVFKSTDAGATWSPASAGLPRGVQGLTIDPADPDILYAATSVPILAGGGIFRTTDGARSWTSLNAGLNSGSATHQFTSIVIDPKSTTTLFAVGDFSLFRSVDGGESWSRADAGIEVDVPTAVALDPFQHGVIYVATSFDGVFKSSDGGATWMPARSGLATAVASLAADPATPGTLYAGTLDGVFKSTDGAATWQPANAGISGVAVLTITIDRSSPATLYIGTSAGIFRTGDGGASWSDLTAFGSRAAPSLVLDPGDGATLYAAAGGDGVARSTDGGMSWVAATSGIRALSILAMAVDPSLPSTLLVSTSSQGVGPIATAGLFVSRDSGQHWQDLTPTGPSDNGFPRPVNALAFDPTNALIVYAGTDAGLFKSANGALSWSPIDSGLPVPNSFGIDFVSGQALAIDPQDPLNVYAGLFFGIHVGGAIAKSTDGGASWTMTPAANVFALAVDPRNPSILFAIGTTLLGSSVSRSQDAGASWQDIFTAPGLLRCLAIDPRTSVVYVGGVSGVFRSADEGNTWTAGALSLARSPETPVASVNSLAVDGATPGVVYAGSLQGSVFRSVDAGLTWTLRRNGATSAVSVLAADPTAAAAVYVGTDGNSVYRATFADEDHHPSPRRIDFRPD